MKTRKKQSGAEPWQLTYVAELENFYTRRKEIQQKPMFDESRRALEKEQQM